MTRLFQTLPLLFAATLPLSAQLLQIPVNVTPQPAPIVVLETPAANPILWGTLNFSGYALLNTPVLSEKLSAGNILVTVTNNGDATSSWSVPALDYGTPSPTVNCTNYPNVVNCANSHFDASWNSGLQPDGVSFVPNGIYTATAIATEPVTPSLTATSTGLTFALDNQTPSPVILSPVNLSGLNTAAQSFQIQYTSPNNAPDISGGQILFAGMSPLGTAISCTVNWTMPDSLHAKGTLAILEGTGISLDLQSPGTLNAPACSASLTASALGLPGVAGNAANQATITLNVTLGAFLGAVNVQASGTNIVGQAGSPSSLTTYTVSSPPPAYYSGPSSLELPNTGNATQSTGSTTITVMASSGSASGVSVTQGGRGSAQHCLLDDGSVIQASFGTAVTVPGYPALVTVPVTLTNVPLGGGCVYYMVGNTPETLTVTTPENLYTYTTNLQVNGPQTLTIPQGWSVSFPIGASVTGEDNSGDGATIKYTYPASGDPLMTWSATQPYSPFTGTIHVDPTLPPGNYLREFWIAAEVDGALDLVNVQQSLPILITVTPAPPKDFSISAPITETVQAGVPVPFSLVVSPVGGFTGTVSLAYDSVGDPTKTNSTLPGAGSITFQPRSVQLNGSPQTVIGTIITTSQTNTGYYQVNINGTAGALTHSVPMSVTVTGGPLFTYSLKGPDSVRAGASATYLVSGIIGGTAPYHYSWSWSGSTPTSSNDSSIMSFWTSTNTYGYIATVKVTDAKKVSVQMSKILSAYPAPQLNISSNPGFATAGQSVTFTMSASGGTPPYNYVWDGPESQTGQTECYIPGTSQTYIYVTGHVIDSKNVSTSSGIYVSVAPGTGAAAGMGCSTGLPLTTRISSPATVLIGEPTVIEALPSGGVPGYANSWRIGTPAENGSIPTAMQSAYGSTVTFTAHSIGSLAISLSTNDNAGGRVNSGRRLISRNFDLTLTRTTEISNSVSYRATVRRPFICVSPLIGSCSSEAVNFVWTVSWDDQQTRTIPATFDPATDAATSNFTAQFPLTDTALSDLTPFAASGAILPTITVAATINVSNPNGLNTPPTEQASAVVYPLFAAAGSALPSTTIPLKAIWYRPAYFTLLNELNDDNSTQRGVSVTSPREAAIRTVFDNFTQIKAAGANAVMVRLVDADSYFGNYGGGIAPYAANSSHLDPVAQEIILTIANSVGLKVIFVIDPSLYHRNNTAIVAQQDTNLMRMNPLIRSIKVSNPMWNGNNLSTTDPGYDPIKSPQYLDCSTVPTDPCQPYETAPFTTLIKQLFDPGTYFGGRFSTGKLLRTLQIEDRLTPAPGEGYFCDGRIAGWFLTGELRLTPDYVFDSAFLETYWNTFYNAVHHDCSASSNDNLRTGPAKGGIYLIGAPSSATGSIPNSLVGGQWVGTTNPAVTVPFACSSYADIDGRFNLDGAWGIYGHIDSAKSEFASQNFSSPDWFGIQWYGNDAYNLNCIPGDMRQMFNYAKAAFPSSDIFFAEGATNQQPGTNVNLPQFYGDAMNMAGWLGAAGIAVWDSDGFANYGSAGDNPNLPTSPSYSGLNQFSLFEANQDPAGTRLIDPSHLNQAYWHWDTQDRDGTDIFLLVPQLPTLNSIYGPTLLVDLTLKGQALKAAFTRH